MFYSSCVLIFLALLYVLLVAEFDFINLCRFFVHLSSQDTSKTIKHLFTGTLRQSRRVVLILHVYERKHKKLSLYVKESK